MLWHSSGKVSQYLASKTIFIQKPIIARVTVDVKKKTNKPAEVKDMKE